MLADGVVSGSSRTWFWLIGVPVVQACSPLLKANDLTFTDAAPSRANLGTSSDHVDVSGAVRIGAPEPAGLFGAAVVLAGDTLAVAAPFASVTKADGAVAKAGAVYLYDLAAGTSRYQTIVVPNADEGDGALPPDLVANNVQKAPFAWAAVSLALSDELLVIGMPGEASARQDDPFDNSAPYSGAVYVYDRTRPGSPPQYIKAPNVDAGDAFGLSISLSGSLLAIGAPREASGDAKNPKDNSAPVSGAVYVYSRDATTGSFMNPIYLKAPQITENGGFGFSVSVSEDHLVAGAPTETNSYENGVPLSGNGGVYVFRRSTGGWELEQSLKAKHPQASGFFGLSLSSLSAGSFVIGATGERDCEPPTGAATTGRGDAYVVHQAGGQWVEDCVVPDTGFEQVIFGWSLAVDGDRYAVGAPYDSSGVVGDPNDRSTGAAGAAYLFGSQAGTKKQYVKAPRPRPSAFGYSLALGAGRLVVGAAYEADPAADSDAASPSPPPPSGAVYIFGLN